jgi:hypothetical protein
MSRCPPAVDWVIPLEDNERDEAWRQLSSAGL